MDMKNIPPLFSAPTLFGIALCIGALYPMDAKAIEETVLTADDSAASDVPQSSNDLSPAGYTRLRLYSDENALKFTSDSRDPGLITLAPMLLAQAGDRLGTFSAYEPGTRVLPTAPIPSDMGGASAGDREETYHVTAHSLGEGEVVAQQDSFHFVAADSAPAPLAEAPEALHEAASAAPDDGAFRFRSISSLPSESAPVVANEPYTVPAPSLVRPAEGTSSAPAEKSAEVDMPFRFSGIAPSQP